MYYDYFMVTKVGGRNGNIIYGVVDTRFPNVGYPEFWGDKIYAEKYYAECILFLKHSEYKKMKKTGYISAYRTRGDKLK